MTILNVLTTVVTFVELNHPHINQFEVMLFLCVLFVMEKDIKFQKLNKHFNPKQIQIIFNKLSLIQNKKDNVLFVQSEDQVEQENADICVFVIYVLQNYLNAHYVGPKENFAKFFRVLECFLICFIIFPSLQQFSF